MPRHQKTLDQANPACSFWDWVTACRPRTLTISLVPVVVATSLAYGQLSELNWTLVIMAFLCSLSIQIGTNLINDALDYKNGVDGTGRLGPQRVAQAGIIHWRNILNAGYLCFAMGAIFGLPLIIAGGWPIAIALIFSIACGYLYTGGPYPLSYTGISDLFVLLFFGWVSTFSIYYLLTGTVDSQCLLAATQVGLLAIVPHAINNLRDHVADARAGKRTLAVRFGIVFTRMEITLLSFLPFGLGLLWVFYDKSAMALLPMIVLPIIIHNIRLVWKTNISALYNTFLAKSARCQLLFALLLSLGSLLYAQIT